LLVIAIMLIRAAILMAGLMLLKQAHRKAKTRKELHEIELALQYTINGTVFTATPAQWEDYNRVDFVLTAAKTINPATQTYVAWTNNTAASAP